MRPASHLISKFHLLSAEDAARVVDSVRLPSHGNIEMLADDINEAFLMYFSDLSSEVRSRAKTIKKLEHAVSRALKFRGVLSEELLPYFWNEAGILRARGPKLNELIDPEYEQVGIRFSSAGTLVPLSVRQAKHS